MASLSGLCSVRPTCTKRVIHDQAAVGERGAGQAGRGDRAGPVRRGAGDDLAPRQAGGRGGVRGGRGLAGGDGRPDRREAGAGGQGRNGGLGGEDLYACEYACEGLRRAGRSRHAGLRLCLPARLCAGGAQGHPRNPGREAQAADRDSVAGAARGVEAAGAKRLVGFGGNAADPGGRLADSL